MDYELAIIPGARIALFRWTGPITFQGRMKNVERMGKFCNENKIKDLIVDTRKQVSTTDMMQMFDLGTSVPELLRGIRIAVVCQSSDHTTKFGETVAANRGAYSRSFTSLEEAQRWLEGMARKPTKPDAGNAQQRA